MLQRLTIAVATMMTVLSSENISFAAPPEFVETTPYQDQELTSVSSADLNKGLEFDVIPEGKRLVMQYVSVAVGYKEIDAAVDVKCWTAGGFENGMIGRTTPALELRVSPNTTRLGPNNPRDLERTASHPVTLSIRAGLVPEINCNFSDYFTAGALITGTVAGYLTNE